MDERWPPRLAVTLLGVLALAGVCCTIPLPPPVPSARAQPSGGDNRPYQYVSAGAGQYAVAITAVQTLTVPAGSVIAEICVETASARYTTTGTTPTSTVGIPVASGGCFQLAGLGDLNAFKIIGAGATMSVEYFK